MYCLHFETCYLILSKTGKTRIIFLLWWKRCLLYASTFGSLKLFVNPVNMIVLLLFLSLLGGQKHLFNAEKTEKHSIVINSASQKLCITYRLNRYFKQNCILRIILFIIFIPDMSDFPLSFQTLSLSNINFTIQLV